MLDEINRAEEDIERAVSIDGCGYVKLEISKPRSRHVPLRGFGGSHVL